MAKALASVRHKVSIGCDVRNASDIALAVLLASLCRAVHEHAMRYTRHCPTMLPTGIIWTHALSNLGRLRPGGGILAVTKTLPAELASSCSHLGELLCQILDLPWMHTVMLDKEEQGLAEVVSGVRASGRSLGGKDGSVAGVRDWRGLLDWLITDVSTCCAIA